MSKTAVITARIDAELAGRLDRLAALRERSRAWLIEKAVAAYVDDDLALRDALQAGEEAIDAGDYLSHEDAMAEVRAALAARRAA